MLPVDPARYALFAGMMAVFAVTPGPANLFAIATGIRAGHAAALRGVVGMNAATLVWLAAAALGLGALVTAFPQAFRVLAIAGGVYVGWLGFKTIRKATDLDNERLDARLTTAAPVRTRWETLLEGFMVQALNPKMVLFLSAVLPPFVDIGRPMPAQMLVFATTTIAMDVVSMTSYGLGAVSLSRLLSQPRNRQRFDFGAGGILAAVRRRPA